MDKRIEEAFSRTKKLQRPILLFGRTMDASEVSTHLRQLVSDANFYSLDCRTSVPDADTIQKAFTAALKNHGTLFVSIGEQWPSDLAPALTAVLSEGRLPGTKSEQAKGWLVMAANVRRLDELPIDLREFFPVCIEVQNEAH